MAYEGTYSDPINHPGGVRRITRSGSSLTVVGGGGRGEPANYQLGGRVDGSGKIFVDFTPKGGPKDFEGFFLSKKTDGGREGIVWTGGGDKELNFWPKTGGL